MGMQFRLFGFPDESMEPAAMLGGLIYRCRPAPDLAVTIESAADWRIWYLRIWDEAGALLHKDSCRTLSAAEKAIKDFVVVRE